MSERIGWLALVLVLGCLPEFDDRPWLVEGPRVLAVATTPAEALPGQQVRLEALVVDERGPSTQVVDWAFCTQPRRAEQRGGVSESCAMGEKLMAVARDALVPADACARFGPNPPPAEGEAPRRPADPDPSGGYFNPVRAATMDAEAFGFVRIHCDLAGATRPLFEAFERRYQLNLNPDFAEAAFEVDGQVVEQGTPIDVRAGQSIELSARVAALQAEDFVVYDIERGLLSPRRERITVRWFVTAGRLGTSRAVAQLGPQWAGELRTTYAVPEDVSYVYVWAVLADDRGGTAWRSLELEVSSPE